VIKIKLDLFVRYVDASIVSVRLKTAFCLQLELQHGQRLAIDCPPKLILVRAGVIFVFLDACFNSRNSPLEKELAR
jgi:hypothetical protein